MSINLSCLAPALRIGKDGIWHAAGEEAISYPSKGNSRCFEVEDRSFWFRHRNVCIVELVKAFPPFGKGPIFDVGGGNGYVAKGLMDVGWRVVLVEPGQAGSRNAKARGVQHVVCATTQAAEFKRASMPAIGVFDVVEHIQDDLAFLRHLWELLEPSGMLYITVPAYTFLWSQHDVTAGHCRRYTLGSLFQKLDSAGFHICYGTYLFRVLPIAVFLLRSLPFRLGLHSAVAAPEDVSKAHGIKAGLTVQLLRRILAAEKDHIAQKHSMGFGGSCLVAAQKIL